MKLQSSFRKLTDKVFCNFVLTKIYKTLTSYRKVALKSESLKKYIELVIANGVFPSFGNQQLTELGQNTY